MRIPAFLTPPATGARRATHREDPGGSLVIAAVLVLAVLALLGDALLGREVLIATDQMLLRAPWRAEVPDLSLGFRPVGDTFDIWDPQRQVFAQALRSGDLALWNPFPSGGAPLAAVPSTGTFGPFQLSYLLLPDWAAPAGVKLAELGVSVGFTFLFLRLVGLGRAAALVGGAVYAFNGFQLVWTNWPQTRVGALLPALLWACERVVTRRRPLDAAVLALVVGALHAEGFPAVTLAGLSAAGLYVVVRAWHGRADVHRAARTLVLAGAGAVVGTGLAACQLLPFAQRLSDLGLTRDQSPDAHLDTVVAATLAAPRIFGDIPHDPFRIQGNYVESLAYVGAAGSALALVGLLRRAPRGATAGVRGFAAVGALLCFVLVFVGGPVLELLQGIPPLDTNFVGRLRAPLALFVAVLAAFGLDGALRAPHEPEPAVRRRVRALAAVGVLAAIGFGVAHVVAIADDHGYRETIGDDLTIVGVLALATLVALTAARWRPARGVAAVVVATLVIGQAIPLWSALLPRSDRDAWFPTTAMHEFLQDQLDDERVATAGSTLIAGSTARYGIRTVTGHVFTQPTWKEMLRGVDREAFGRSPTYSYLSASDDVAASPLLDRMGARYFAMGERQAILGFDGAAAPPAERETPVTLAPGGTASVDAPVERLRGVVIHLVEPLATSDPLARLRATARDGRGTVLATGSRRIHGRMPAKPYAIPLAAEADTRSGTEVRIELTLDATDGRAQLAGDGTDAWMQPVEGDDDLRLVFSDGGQIYQRLDALPRVRWASRTRVVPDDEARLAALEAGVPADTVVLDRPGPRATGRPAHVEVVEDGLDTMTVDVDAAGDGYLVVADALQLGWTATVDGEEADLVDADHAFGAVSVPKGRHRVTVSYHPPGLDTGWWITAASAAAILGAVAVHLVERRRGQRPGGTPAHIAADPPATRDGPPTSTEEESTTP